MPAVDDFLKMVMRSALLSREQLQQALRTVPRDQRDNPELVAEHLVKEGQLSRFQARKLLQGKPLGLMLGPYQVLAPIGKGGMGTVYLARDTQSQQLLALKVLGRQRAREEPRLLARFQREMELCQRISHSHLAYTIRADVHQGVHYIAMEYIPGKSLFRVVHSEGPLGVPRAASLFAEVALALDHVHDQGMIHRDLKPSNIIVTPQDHAKLLDLGLALVRGEDCSRKEVIGGPGYVVGTMDYIAPEQADDCSRVDARSDVYGLGCTLYYALAGRPPFPGGTPAEKIHHHRHDEPTPLPQLNPDVPPAFVGLMRRMMHKKPGLRFSTAAAVREALLPWAAGDQVPPPDAPAGDDLLEVLAVVEAEEDSSAEAIAVEAVDADPADPDTALSAEALTETARPGTATVRQAPVNGKPSAVARLLPLPRPSSRTPSVPVIVWLLCALLGLGVVLLLGGLALLGLLGHLLMR